MLIKSPLSIWLYDAKEASVPMLVGRGSPRLNPSFFNIVRLEYLPVMSALQPPNFQQLTDTVLGSVNQRLVPIRFNVRGAIYRPTSMHHFSTPELSTYPPKANVSTRSNVRLSTIEANKRDAAALRRRRERNRLHQARYKRNQDAHMAAMEDNIRQLHGEIRKLQLQRQLLLLSPSKMNSWSVVAEYFRLFRFGVNPTASETRLHASVENVYPIDRQVQRNFLLATMMPDVTDGIVVGVDAIMMNWEYVTQRLPGLQIEVTCLENGPKGSIVATTQHTLTFSKMMLHHIFPHLSRAEKKSSDIADKLLGHQILIRSTVHFEWDSENCRVSSFETKADMVTPVLRLVGNLDDVSHIFSKACLTPEFGFVRGADTGFVGTDPAM